MQKNIFSSDKDINIEDIKDILEKEEMMGEDIEEFLDFIDIFVYRIKELTDKINSQFRRIVPSGVTKTEIILELSGTRVELEQAIIDNIFNTKLILHIGFYELKVLYETREDLDMFECFCKIVTHEYLHVLLGHLERKTISRNISYTYGELDKDDAYILNSPFYVVSFDRKPKGVQIDPCIFNIAADFEINNALGLTSPFLRASDFFLPEGLKTEEYYSIIFHLFYTHNKNAEYLRTYFGRSKKKLQQIYSQMKEEMNEQFKNGDGKISTPSSKKSENSNETSGEGESSSQAATTGELKENKSEEFEIGNTSSKVSKSLKEKDGNFSLYDIGSVFENNGNYNSNFKFSRKRSDRAEIYMKEIKFERCNSRGDLPGDILKLQHRDSGIWKEFREILNFIKSREKDMNFALVDKRDDWCKFNNRKDGSMIYPGKYQIEGKIEKKFLPTSILFVDVSSSMGEYVSPIFTFCYLLLKSLNIKIAFYDTDLITVYDKSDKFKLEPFIAGGTDFKSSFETYVDKYKKPRNIYVLTDGYDNYNFIKNDPNCHIWIINGKHINKMKGGQFNG